MKRALKYVAAWLVLMVLSGVAANFFLAQYLSEAILIPALSGYTERMAFPLPEPTNDEEEKKNGGALIIRSLLCNYESFEDHGLLANATYENMGWEESYVFLNPQGEHAFSYGIFAYVYQDLGEDEKTTQHPTGLIDINALIQRPEFAGLTDAVAAHPDADMWVTEFTAQDYLVDPHVIVLKTAAGEELARFGSAASEASDITTGENYRIYNNYSADDEYTGMLAKLRLAAKGERETDRLAAELAQKAMQGEIVSEDSSSGIGTRTNSNVFEENGYKMVHVTKVYFWKGVLFYTVLLGGVMTLIFAAVCIVRGKLKKRKAAAN